MHEPKCSREGPACISYLASIPSTHAGREDPSTFRIHLYAAVEVPLFVLRHLVGYPRSQSASRGGLAANVQWRLRTPVSAVRALCVRRTARSSAPLLPTSNWRPEMKIELVEFRTAIDTRACWASQSTSEHSSADREC